MKKYFFTQQYHGSENQCQLLISVTDMEERSEPLDTVASKLAFSRFIEVVWLLMMIKIKRGMIRYVSHTEKMFDFRLGLDG